MNYATIPMHASERFFKDFTLSALYPDGCYPQSRYLG
jgi:hypothetical protein